MPANQRSNTIDRLAVDSTEKSVQKKKLYSEIENMFSKECHQASKESSASHSKAREYELQKCIGQGAYAKVYKAIHLPTKTKVAIKLYEKSKLSEKLRQKSIKREIKILSRLNHPNIVNFIDCFSTKNHIYLVMELVRGLSLYELLKKQPERKIKESNGKTIIKQILKAMSYCHSKCVSHRDIKLENVIISGNGEVKVIDFGFSTCIPNEKKVKMFCGTPSYMAPEIVQKIEYCGPPVDIWATGVLFYVLISGKFPFRGNAKF
jgi:serine/threonine protein kinase